MRLVRALFCNARLPTGAMPPANWNHEEVDGDQLGAPTPFAVTLATAMANYRGREGHEIAKLRASIPGIIEEHWKEWKPKMLACAAAGNDKCWFRFHFTCFTHYTPTIEDIKEGLPADLRQMHEDGRLKITRATQNYPNRFNFNLNYSDLAEAKFREMEATQTWPAETAETRESVNKCQQEWNREARKRKVRNAALESKGWVQHFRESGKIHYTTKDGKREAREWPDEVPKPSFDEIAAREAAARAAAPEDAEAAEAAWEAAVVEAQAAETAAGLAGLSEFERVD